MDEVIHSASGLPSCMVSMDVVICSAPATVPAALSTSPSQRLGDGPRQLFQTYGFVAREAPEEDEESAAAEVAAAAAAAAAAEAEAAAAACCCKPEQILLQS
jgi:hypothetical protein